MPLCRRGVVLVERPLVIVRLVVHLHLHLLHLLPQDVVHVRPLIPIVVAEADAEDLQLRRRNLSHQVLLRRHPVEDLGRALPQAGDDLPELRLEPGLQLWLTGRILGQPSDKQGKVRHRGVGIVKLCGRPPLKVAERQRKHEGHQVQDADHDEVVLRVTHDLGLSLRARGGRADCERRQDDRRVVLLRRDHVLDEVHGLVLELAHRLAHFAALVEDVGADPEDEGHEAHEDDVVVEESNTEANDVPLVHVLGQPDEGAQALAVVKLPVVDLAQVPVAPRAEDGNHVDLPVGVRALAREPDDAKEHQPA
mmetsp:Transcript_96135/g.255429  ORF Transcript_96135/g.255429 Transcript_96135/m.255429 type:complete len:308 (+) Transcript_96135:2-925(+)